MCITMLTKHKRNLYTQYVLYYVHESIFSTLLSRGMAFQLQSLPHVYSSPSQLIINPASPHRISSRRVPSTSKRTLYAVHCTWYSVRRTLYSVRRTL